MVSEMVNTEVFGTSSPEAFNSPDSSSGPRRFVFQFFSSAAIKAQLEELLALYMCQFHGSLYSLKHLNVGQVPFESPVVSLETYRSDDHFVANLSHHLEDLIKLELTWSTLDGNQSSRHAFGEIQAHLRFIISSIDPAYSKIRTLNDNFLNFTTSTSLDVETSYQRLQWFGAKNHKVAKLIEAINTQLDRYPSSEQFWLSFNGGKDCTVLLHALVTILYHRRAGLSFELLNLLLIQTCEEPFPEQDRFIRRLVAYFRCRLVTYQSTDLKTALWALKGNQTSLEAIWMGVRRSDLPEAVRDRLKPVQVTDIDRGWPQFARLSPLLEWTYSDIWKYILELGVPVCPLYDYGYTSIGEPSNTIPNETLKKSVDDVEAIKGQYYLPAYLLDQESTERNSRL